MVLLSVEEPWEYQCSIVSVVVKGTLVENNSNPVGETDGKTEGPDEGSVEGRVEGPKEGPKEGSEEGE